MEGVGRRNIRRTELRGGQPCQAGHAKRWFRRTPKLTAERPCLWDDTSADEIGSWGLGLAMGTSSWGESLCLTTIDTSWGDTSDKHWCRLRSHCWWAHACRPIVTNDNRHQQIINPQSHQLTQVHHITKHTAKEWVKWKTDNTEKE